MREEPQRRRRLKRVTVLLAAIAAACVVYPATYYGSTTLTVGTPQLDWYAHRKFSSKVHFALFFPMFYWESHYDRSNPGYTLQAEISK
jgi:hypothetical protein